MVNFPGRNGRRRRVLKEEVLAASSAHASRQSAGSDDDYLEAPRYSDAAGVENHPQITDFIPRRYRTIGLLVAVGAVTTATLGSLDYFSTEIATFAGLPSVRPFSIALPGSIAAWASAVVLFLASLTCLLIYSIRRHRIDDFRGRYRVWLGASLACLLLSANSVTGMHQVIAHALSHIVGWTALRDGAVWWLAIAGAPLAWIGVRALLDVRECRLAGVFVLGAIACYVASAMSHFGVILQSDSETASIVTGATLLLGYWLLFASTITYARFVILDAQGLIAVRKLAEKQLRCQQKDARRGKTAGDATTVESKPSVLSVVNYAREKAAQADADDDDRWVDGRKPERKKYSSYDDEEDDEESSSGSKISKTDRKRLRKLKSQNRAA
jgi:hypothetical protein